MAPDLHRSKINMVREERVREVLELDDGCRLDERGVYRTRSPEEMADGPRGRIPMPPGEILLGAEWLSDLDLEQHFSDDPVLGAVLPHGRVKRLDLDPRIVVLEGIPEPSMQHGPVVRARGGWLLDARGDEPVALAVAWGDHDVLLWGEDGDFRVYTLRRR